MNNFSKKYIFQWMSFIALILSSVFLLFTSLSKDISQPGNFPILIAAGWILLVSSGIYLFIHASTKELSEDLSKKASSEPEEKDKKIISPVKEEKLDIQTIARKFSRKIHIEDEPVIWGKQMLDLFAKEIEIMSGLFYFRLENKSFNAISTYAYPLPGKPYSFMPGEGLTGQAAKNMRVAFYRNIPEEYGQAFSGLGSSKPLYIAMMPIVQNDRAIAVVEIAGFRYASDQLEHLFQITAKEINEKLQQTTKIY